MTHRDDDPEPATSTRWPARAPSPDDVAAARAYGTVHAASVVSAVKRA
jgi:hypothetical protein